jgi:hypothetical protein
MRTCLPLPCTCKFGLRHHVVMVGSTTTWDSITALAWDAEDLRRLENCSSCTVKKELWSEVVMTRYQTHHGLQDCQGGARPQALVIANCHPRGVYNAWFVLFRVHPRNSGIHWVLCWSIARSPPLDSVDDTTDKQIIPADSRQAD